MPTIVEGNGEVSNVGATVAVLTKDPAACLHSQKYDDDDDGKWEVWEGIIDHGSPAEGVDVVTNLDAAMRLATPKDLEDLGLEVSVEKERTKDEQAPCVSDVLLRCSHPLTMSQGWALKGWMTMTWTWP